MNDRITDRSENSMKTRHGKKTEPEQKKELKAGSAAGRDDRKGSGKRFLLWTAGFYAMMMTLYLYFMLANLSSAPKFVYTQF